ncbi:M14 family zinc carboxypeptidase [Coralloluteibacterium thermophilus]|uniref:M14 family zinc carboxypeptidase n=1 Tax=Coralloluteibacterium thermophilum TaxID=2707049 RepID=A0ABV9NNY7_9GAMM
MPHRGRCAPVLAVLALLLLLAANATAAPLDYYLPETDAADLDPAIPSPEAFLGYPIGTHYTRHDRLVAYFEALAEASEAVAVERVGESYERRPLIAVTITSPRNHARLDAIRAQRATVLDPDAPAPAADAPVVVLLGYSVHGNETSGAEAALLTAYTLAASRNAETRRWLEQAVVIIDPAQNPDGRDRSASWHNAYGGVPAVADPNDIDHQQAFPGGRTNHYFTDLNRDWLAIAQQETPPRIEVFHRWYPHVHIDFHEMGSGSTYYFEPSPASMHSPLIPQASYDFNATLARYHAEALDAIGSLYYTGENFDNFSPVYGSTYPDFHGGVGVTVEQASSRGLAQETDSGVLTFPFTIRNQVRIGLASVRGAVAEREGLFALQRDFYRSALRQARAHPARAFVFGDADDPTLTRRLLELLLRHRIRVHALDADVSLDGIRFAAGSAYVVPAEQPQFRLVHAIFEETPEVQGAVYGSTSYAIAHAYGLPFARARRAVAAGTRVTALPPAAPGGVAGGPARYAYALEWRDTAAPRALRILLERGVRVRAAFAPFAARTAAGERRFGHGSLVVPVAGQDLDGAALLRALEEAGAEAGVTFHALATGLNPEGVDLGSDRIRPLRAPSVALVMGRGVNATEIGSTWFLLERRLGMPATRLDPAQLARVPLQRYTHLVLASGDYGDWSAATVDAVKRWVAAGGTLVTYGSGSRWAVEQGLAEGVLLREPEALPSARRDFGEQRDAHAAERIAGNLLSADADPSHPLAFGVPQRRIFVNKDSDVVPLPVANPYATAVRIDDAPLVNGYLSERQRARLGGGAYLQVVDAGRGRVVLFSDDPAHRKYWHGTERLLVNALYFADHLATSPGRR